MNRNRTSARGGPVLPPDPQPDWTLLFDFDGTVAALAPRPDLVVIEERLKRLLMDWQRALGGAVAVVTGRPLDQIDQLLQPLALAGAGQHGAELRHCGGCEPIRLPPPAGLETARRSLRQFVAGEPRAWLEEKPNSLALHYRQAPHLAGRCRAAAAEAARDAGLEVLHGRCVFELRDARTHKGEAIAALLEIPPFRGRVPVFAGDDVTDEDGFAVVRGRGGVTIKVGEGETRAQYRLPSVPAFLQWLEDGAALLNGTR